jgi:hypothetical protein
MEEMFYRASAFNQDIRSWDVSDVVRNFCMLGPSSIQQSDFLPNAWRNDEDQKILFMESMRDG